ncbi:MAG: DUF6326 family protein [Chloroflexota bacterium]
MNNYINVKKPVLLSTLWVFVMLNMIFADIVSFISPSFFDDISQMSDILTPSTLLVFAVLLEIPIAMVLLSRILNKQANRWAHVIAVPITIVFVVGGGSLSLHYVFFAAMEIVAMLVALNIAWKDAAEPQVALAR